jgi:hypothetical protein
MRFPMSPIQKRSTRELLMKVASCATQSIEDKSFISWLFCVDFSTDTVRFVTQVAKLSNPLPNQLLCVAKHNTWSLWFTAEIFLRSDWQTRESLKRSVGSEIAADCRKLAKQLIYYVSRWQWSFHPCVLLHQILLLRNPPLLRMVQNNFSNNSTKIK